MKVHKAISRFAPRALAACLVLGSVWVLVQAADAAYDKASAAYRAHRLAEESTVEWHEKQLAKVMTAEYHIRNNPYRCSSTTNTFDLVRQYEIERQRLWAATFRYAGGSQYQGVEKILPQRIVEIECGVMKLVFLKISNMPA